MNLIKKLTILTALAVGASAVFSSSAHADDEVDTRVASSYWVENPNLSVEFTQGDDWGKLNANHTELTPRDNECDGHEVVFYLRDNHGGTYDFREIRDQNGCDTGGGMGTINPNNWDYVKLCEYVGDGTAYCTNPYYLPWG